jgi:hypothetical protein
MRIAVAVALVGVVVLVMTLRHRAPGAGGPGQRYDYKPQPQNRPGGVSVRPMDTDIFAAIEKGDLSHAQLLDLFKDRPYHVKLVANGEDHRVGFVLIDFHRSGQWNERWELKQEGVLRYTLGGAEDSPPGVMFTLRAGYWIPH